MKTIGQILKDARIDKRYSVIKLEEITKIKSSFIESLEEQKWNTLPAFPTVLGFAKSIAGSLGLDEKTVVATLKRDYPPKKLNINPTPDISSKFVWSPKFTFGIGITFFLLFVFGYLFFQYKGFVSSPRLTVESPKDDQKIIGNSVLVFGSTDIDAKIIVNNQPVFIDIDGKFSVSLEVVKDTKEIEIKAISRSGKETVVRRTIDVRPNN